MGKRGVEALHVGHGENGIEGGDNGARREHLGHRDVVEADGIRHKVALSLGNLAGAGGGAGNATNLGISKVGAGLNGGSEAVVKAAESTEQAANAANEDKGGDKDGGEAEAEVGADFAREHAGGPREAEGDGEEGEGREQDGDPAARETGEDVGPKEDTTEEGTETDEGSVEEVEGSEDVGFVITAALEGDGRTGMGGANAVEFLAGVASDHAMKQGDPGGLEVEGDKDDPEPMMSFHVGINVSDRQGKARLKQSRLTARRGAGRKKSWTNEMPDGSRFSPA
jgi:hypothetical protein